MVVVDSDSVVSVVDLEEDLGEVKAAEVDSDSGEETAAAKGREAPADLDSAARVEVVTAKVEAAREKEAKAKKAEELRVKKEEAARKLREKEEAAKIPPGEMFKVGEHAGTYSKYDDDGAEVAKAQRKKLAKFQAAQKKEHEKYLAKCAADGVDAMKV